MMCGESRRSTLPNTNRTLVDELGGVNLSSTSGKLIGQAVLAHSSSSLLPVCPGLQPLGVMADTLDG